jgi:hypothetical protein
VGKCRELWRNAGKCEECEDLQGNTGKCEEIAWKCSELQGNVRKYMEMQGNVWELEKSTSLQFLIFPWHSVQFPWGVI